MKKLLGVIAILAIAAVIWFVTSLDDRIKNHIEQTATKLAGVPVTIGSVDISIFNGTGEINELTVKNPKGYSQGNAFEMNSIRIDVALGSVFKQPFVVNELVIDSPVINLELKEDYQSNLQDIVNTSIQQNKAGSDSGESSTSTTESAVTGGEAQNRVDSNSREELSDEDYFRMVFKQLDMVGITFSAKRGNDEWTDTLPAVSMKDLGGDEGIGTRALGITIVSKLTKETVQQAAKRKLTDVAEEKLKTLGEKLLESLNN
jgi:hypothetical protein